MTQYNPVQLEELRELSTGMLDAIRRVIRDEPADPQRFLGQMRRLTEGFGVGGAAFAIRAWLDQVREAFPDIPHGQIGGVAFANSEGTGFESPDDMSIEYRWAATALAARMGDNQASLYELIDALPAGRLSVYLLRTVELVAGILDDRDRTDRPGPLHTGDVVRVAMIDS
jgi:hypothetical protein